MPPPGPIRPGCSAWCAKTSIGTIRFDKLVGALARCGRAAAHGFVLSTARCSHEIVGKAVLGGATTLVSISLPTSLAVERARAAGLSLWALAFDDSVLMISDAASDG